MNDIFKVISIIIHFIIKYHRQVHHYATVGQEERITGSVPKDFKLFERLCAEGITIPTRRTGRTTVPERQVRIASRYQTFPYFGQNIRRKVRVVARSMSRTFPTDANPFASFTDKLVIISYLACQPHPRHVVCTGGYSDSLSQWTVLSCSTSCHLRSHTHSDLTPRKIQE